LFIIKNVLPTSSFDPDSSNGGNETVGSLENEEMKVKHCGIIKEDT
jgi:hypothetical protein